jgi:hypothetical protein
MTCLTYRYTSDRALRKAYKKAIKQALYHHGLSLHYTAQNDEAFARTLADEMERRAVADERRRREFYITGGY